MSTRSEETPSQPTGGSVGWETVHVFVSSTFNDMHGERDYLVKEVFPELRDWCEERKLRLVDIDLRWGVSEADATHNQRVVEVCLQNIDRCRPFFLCFLGQRYGWVPGLGDVSAETLARYPGLKAAIVEQRSVTELELLHAVVAPFVGGEAKLAADQSFFYLRQPDFLTDIPAEPAQLKRIYTDEAEKDAQSRAFLVDRQNKLREAVSSQEQRPARQYSARWSNAQRTPELTMPLDCPATLRENQDRWRRDWQRSGEVSIPEGALSVPAAQLEKATAYNQRLCAGRLGDFWSDGRSLTEVIIADLKAAILERYPERKELPEQDELSREIDRHEDFVRTAADVFIERPGDFADLDAYAAGDSQRLFALVAKAGLGKSTLLANWVAQWRSRGGKPADETVHARFVGVGERSNNVDSLLRSILEELRRGGKLTSEIPDNGNVLRSRFCELLGECGKKGRTIVVIDALNQLQSGLTDLDWIARTLPENVKLVVSFKLGDAGGDALAAQLRADERVTLSEVRPFAGLEERRRLVRQFLRQFLKELDEQHLEALIRADGADNPLFLKVVLTELRVFGAFGQLGEVIRREFGTTPQSAFEAVLRRLESDPSYAAVPSQQAVPLLFGLLAHSRGGLPEDLLARMFLAELGLGEERLADMAATIQLFLRQVRPFLARREGRVDFFYEAFQLAARARYAETASETLPRTQGGSSKSHTGLNSPGAMSTHTLGLWQKLIVSVRAMGRSRRRSPGPASGLTIGLPDPSLLRRPGDRWHVPLARACERWAGLEHTAKRYALGNLVYHEVGSGNGTDAADTITGFAYQYERLKTLGPDDVADVAADFSLAARAANVRSAGGERLGLWKAFHAEHAHLLRRRVRNLSPETYLLQLAVAHAETSMVTESAERWLETVGNGAYWLRLLGRPLYARRNACLRTFEEHAKEVISVAVSPNGMRALSGSWDNTLKLWALDTGRSLRTFRGHTGAVEAVAISADGMQALSGSADDTLKLWDLESGECLRTFRLHTESIDPTDKGVRSVAILPDGKRALSGNASQTLKLWDLESGECLRTFRGHKRCINAVAILPDGKRAISASTDKTLKLWNLKTGTCLRTFEGHVASVFSVAVLPDGKRALSASDDNTLKLWDIETGWCLNTLHGHADDVCDLAVLPDGKRALSGSRDNTLKLWDLETGHCQRNFEGCVGGAVAIALLPDGEHAVSGGGDSALRLWDLAGSDRPSTPPRLAAAVTVIRIAPNGKLALSAERERSFRLWDLDTGQCLRTFKSQNGSVTALAILPDNRRALSAGWGDPALELWDLDTGRCLRTFKMELRLDPDISNVRTIELHPNGKHVLTVTEDGRVRACDLETGFSRERTRLPSLLMGKGLEVTPDCRRALRYDKCDSFDLWDLEAGQRVCALRGHADDVCALAVLPDSKRALSGSRDKTLKLWDLETAQCLRTFEGHTDGVHGVALLPDDRRALSASSDGTLKLWDLETGRCVRTLGRRGELVAVLSSGKHALCKGESNTLKVWDLETGLPIAAWQVEGRTTSCVPVMNTVVVGTEAGDVLFLKLMPPGRICPETIAATWHLSRPLLAAARANGTILLQSWHAESQYLEELARTSIPSVASVQWSPDGAHLLATARDGATHILDSTTLQPAAAAAAPTSPFSAARDISPDGHWRAVIEAGQLRIVPATET